MSDHDDDMVHTVTHACAYVSIVFYLLLVTDHLVDTTVPTKIFNNVQTVCVAFRAGLSIPEALGKLSIGGPLPT